MSCSRGVADRGEPRRRPPRGTRRRVVARIAKGFRVSRPAISQRSGLALRSAMSQVSLHVGRAVYSYADLYRGFGLTVRAYLLFGAMLTWELPKLLVASPELFRTITIGFMAVRIAGVALSLFYFAAPQAVFSLAQPDARRALAARVSVQRAVFVLVAPPLTASSPECCASSSPCRPSRSCRTSQWSCRESCS